MTGEPPSVTRIGDGVYRVVHEGRAEIVYVAGPPDDRWAFSNGRVFRGNFAAQASSTVRPAHDVAQSLTAPMPATVLKVLVEADAKVGKGDTLIILEAMKMELPIRATRNALVTAVHCREGQLVQAGTVLIDLR